MLCEKCGQREATVHICFVADGNVRNRDLCVSCSQLEKPELTFDPFGQREAANKLESIVAGDPRYRVEAYKFVLEAVSVALMMATPIGEFWHQRHISGRDLLEALRVMARMRYGSRAKATLKNWGVSRCEDFGEIVFNLVNSGMLGKQAEDRREDFSGGYSFDEAFPEG